MVDTPGLLDRPRTARNTIELQAIAALEHIGSLVLFLMDESEACGTSIDEQMNLLEDVQAMLPGTDLMVVTSKADLLDPLPDMWTEVSEAEAEWRDDGAEGTPDLPLLLDPKGRVTMSATEFIGMDAMRMEIIRRIKDARQIDPMALPEGWYRRDQD
jgi:nucleolar GTP-binding protein